MDEPMKPHAEPSPRTATMAIGSLIAGIAGFFCVPVIGPILAIIFGLIALTSIRSSGGRLTGHGMAVGGLIVGIVGLLAHAAFIVGSIFLTQWAVNMAKGLEEFQPAIRAFKDGDVDTAATLLAARSNLTAEEIKARIFAAHRELGEVHREELARSTAKKSTGMSDVNLELVWNLYGEKSDGHVVLQIHYDGSRWTMKDLTFQQGTVPVEQNPRDWD